ncbi:acyl-CoA reductase-like NAD-dependent aldehyde dehydrogenase [Pseudarthrobacter sp. W1I19]|uniref:aldehyde dehydrogenase (NADP(+)) n=1 Tax=Pseudarthrobacter sp. W1I19 TaxID=3042288 RepID=UPI0027802B6F|nr:aldehyde dehydrogenase (NADP(+)) [Pseudarthrobacter sp. W1I19]MDQ0921889.1 acyl-CoA reductase-like NAD-dependent aldehyde dehydrogenase [Pseudarthrobacter sp. W1I19]
MTTSAAGLRASVDAAHAAFEKARTADPSTRAGWLDAVAAGLEKDADVLVALAAKETHLAEARLRGELKRSTFQLGLFADEIRNGEHFDATIDHADQEWGMGPRPDLRRYNVPLGVVGVFGASNFPFAFSVMGGDSASALAAGCAVVHKAHDGHLQLALRTAETVVAALDAAGAPSGLFSLVTGRAAAEALVDHPLVKAIGFTGSTAGGRALFNRAAARPEPIPFFGELGGINAVFVTGKAWNARAGEIIGGYANSFTLGMGQFCTKPGLLFVPRGHSDAVRTRLEQALAGFTPAPLLSERLHEGFTGAVRGLRATKGVDVLVEGDFAECPAPTVLRTSAAAVREDPSILRQEMFGPASLMVEYGDESELPALAGLLEGQLTTTLQAEADDDVADLAERLTDISGRVLWNGWPTGVTVSYAQHHGGPYPATSSNTTSVGTAAIRRFLRPVAYQSFPVERLPEPLQDANPWRVPQRVDGEWRRPGTDSGTRAGEVK